MGRHTAGLGRFLAATSLAAGLLLCTSTLPAQEPASTEEAAAPQVQLTAEGTYASFQPVARVRIDRPGYVSLFEVEPGVGATMLYPDDPSDPERFAAGTHELRLNGLPTASRRRLMAWHLGWAFSHRPRLVPENHLVAVASERPLDVSGLRSRRIFPYTKSFAGAGEVTGALLTSVTDGLDADAWSAARTSYDKWRDPSLLARSGPWLDAPFLPLARELVFTGWPPPGDPRAWTRQVAAADGRQASGSGADGTEAEATSPSETDETSEPLPGEVREALRRIADAAESGRRSGTLRSLRHLESIGQAMRARGIGVDAERLGTLRWEAEARARVLDRIGVDATTSRGIPPAGRDLGADRWQGTRGADPGAGIPDRSAHPSDRDAQRRTPDRVRRGDPPAKSPESEKAENSGGDSGQG